LPWLYSLLVSPQSEPIQKPKLTRISDTRAKMIANCYSRLARGVAAISFFAAEQWGLLGTATTIIGALLAGGVIGFAEADFAGLAFSALLFLALAVAIRSNFLMALVPLTLAGRSGAVPATGTPSTC
jgi:hypothetical protein